MLRNVEWVVQRKQSGREEDILSNGKDIHLLRLCLCPYVLVTCPTVTLFMFALSSPLHLE